MPETIAAQSLVTARRAAAALPGFPGSMPETLDAAYAIQAATIAGWGEPVAGWKVGRITGDAATQYGSDRFIGPVFAPTIANCTGDEPADFPMIVGGSAALEAELIAVLGQDVPAGRADWTPSEVAALIGGYRIGIEVAGCPVPDVGDLGPLASIAAFGNNLALLLGPEVADWASRDLDAVTCRSTIDGKAVGQGRAGDLPGGIWTAVAFALNQAARLSISLPRGTYISTGAITGVHPVSLGQDCEADFGALGRVLCRTVTATGSS